MYVSYIFWQTIPSTIKLTFSMRQPRRNPDHVLLQHVLNDMQNEPSAWPFVKPVDKNVVEDYYNVIKEPMGEWHLPG